MQIKQYQINDIKQELLEFISNNLQYSGNCSECNEIVPLSSIRLEVRCLQDILSPEINNLVSKILRIIFKSDLTDCYRSELRHEVNSFLSSSEKINELDRKSSLGVSGV